MSKLDILVAEKVMGWELISRDECSGTPTFIHREEDCIKQRNEYWNPGGFPYIAKENWSPSACLDDALLCLERAANGAAWGSRLGKIRIYWVYINSDGPMYEANHEKLTIAMCLCALRASGVPESLITQAMEEK